jgi:sialic acid synthase SpsE
VKKPVASEEKARRLARRSIVAKCAIPCGEVVTASMLVIKRPGTGIEPLSLRDVIGKRAKTNIREDEVLQWEMLG